MENQISKRDFFFGLVDATVGRWVIQNKFHKMGSGEIPSMLHSEKYQHLVNAMVIRSITEFVELKKRSMNEEKEGLFLLC